MKHKAINMMVSLLLVLNLFGFSMNIQASSKSKLVDDFDSTWVYSAGNSDNGGWNMTKNYTPDMDFVTTEHYSNSVGATVEISFYGTKFELYGKKAPEHSIFTISIDGGSSVEVDEYAPQKSTNNLLYASEDLNEGDHIAKIEVINKRNPDFKPASNGKMIGIQFEYAKVYYENEQRLPYTRVEDSVTSDDNEPFTFKYTGLWRAETGFAELSNGDDHYSAVKDPNSYFEITFIGNKIELYGTKRNKHGDYIVYLDGVEHGKASGYTTSSEKIHKQKLYEISGLEEKKHTVKVALDPNTPDSRKCIQIDYADIYHEPIPGEKIELSTGNLMLEAGTSKSVDAKITPWYAEGSLVWESSNEDVAVVDQEGHITATNNPGSAVIRVSIANTSVEKEIAVEVIPRRENLYAYVGNKYRLEISEDYEKLYDNTGTYFKETTWRGDFTNSKIVVLTRDDKYTNVDISATDFKSGDNVLSSENIEINWMKDVLANIGNSQPSAPVKLLPDVIYKDEAIDIDKNQARFAWITINVPADTKPGTYKGQITVTANELKNPYVFDYEIEVLDLLQPTVEETNTSIQLWQHPYSVAGYYGLSEDEYFTDKHFKYMEGITKEYYELGGRDVAVNIVEEAWNHQSYYGDPSMVKWTKKSDGSWEFNYDWYDAWINFMIDNQIINPSKGIGQIKCFSMVPWNNQIQYYDEAQGTTVKKSFTPGSDEWKEVWTIFLTDFMEHSVDKGWFDITYISMDERPMSTLEPTVNLIKSIKNSEGKTFKVSSCFNYVNTAEEEFTDKIDDFSMSINHFDHNEDVMKEFSQHRQEKGLLTTIYTCQARFPGSFAISDYANNYWVMWDTLAQNTNGFLKWALDNWVENPLENMTYSRWEPGDMWFLYPVEKDTKEHETFFYSTVRYEMLKKGAYDIMKAKYLMSRSDSVNQKMEELLDSMTMPNYKKEYGSTVAASEKDRQILFDDSIMLNSGLMNLSKEYLQTTKADYTAVDEAIHKASLLLEKDYTKDSWEALQTEINSVIRDLSIIDQDKVDQMAENIEKAMESLVRRGDKTQLQKRYDELVKVDTSIYTEESKEHFEKALREAKEILEDENAVQKTVDQALENMEKAYADLEKMNNTEPEEVNKKDLWDLLEKYDNYHSKDYTKESWKIFFEAYKKAGEVATDENATQQEVDKAYKELQAAGKALVEVSDLDEDKIGDNEHTSMPVDTASAVLVMPYVATMIIAVSAVFIMMRKRKNKI